MKGAFITFWRLLVLTGEAWLKDRAARLGASLAFYSVLSLGPMLLLVLVAAAYIWGQQAATGQIVAQMKSIIGVQGALFIQDILKSSSENHSGSTLATIFGFATLLFSASAVFGELQEAMNIIWKVPRRKGVPVLIVLRDRFLSFTMVIGSGFLLLTSLVISAAVDAISHYAYTIIPSLVIIMPVVDLSLSLLIITCIFALTFKMVPDRYVSWRSVWPGAMLTALLFIIGKMLIGIYLARTSVASSYGAAGSVIIILLWVYYSAQILFFGAEFSHVYSEFLDQKKPKKKKSA